MRQHPIPQNILDVEFKLFTKFTVKEFAYIATGVVIGGIFIYLWTQNRIPGIIAFPSFAMFAGIGLILGLVPIQDQPADKILSNYIKAINRPTLRVWQGEEMKLRMKAREDAGKSGIVEVQQTNATQVNLADVEEEERFEQIGKMMEETGLKSQEVVRQQPETSPQATNNNGPVVLTSANIGPYLVPNVKIQLAGTINLLITNKQNQPVTNATVIVKDSSGKTRMAMKSGTKGELLTTQKLENGEYLIEIMHNQYSFSPIKFIVEKPVHPMFRIISL